MIQRKFVLPDGRISIWPNTDQYASAVMLTDENPNYVGEEAWMYVPGKEVLKLYLATTSARLTKEDEMPAWRKIQIVKYDRELKEMASYNRATKELVFNEDVSANNRAYGSANEVLAFAMDILFDKNIYLYELVTKMLSTNVNAYKLTDGILSIVQSPERATVIETMAKTVGEKTALTSIMNNLEIGESKSKKAILSQSQFKDLQTLKMAELIPLFQRLVQAGVLSIDQLDELIQCMKYLIKFGFITHSDLNSVWSRYENQIAEKKINMIVVFESVLTSFLKHYDVSGKYRNVRRRGGYYGYYDLSFKKLLAIYLDAIVMLDEEKIANPKFYKTDNVESYHAITVRNVKQMQNASDEEFELARVRLRKMIWENKDYVFRPFKDKEETAYAGSCLNNCLGACIQGICEGRVIIAVFRKDATGSTGDCPEFVIEVSPHLDIIEASTYNNVDIADAERLKVIREYIESRRYLLSNGRSVYRDPDPNEDLKAKKAEIKAQMNA